MTAAERGLPKSSSPSWLEIAKNVFDEQAGNWDTETCEGGLRWQVYTFNTGYNYKNSISNALFFQLAARLGAFTGNQTYLDWAERTYNWTKSIGLISEDFGVYDGAIADRGCTDMNRVQWSYNPASFIYGSAVLYNHVRWDPNSLDALMLIRPRLKIPHGEISPSLSLAAWTSFSTMGE